MSVLDYIIGEKKSAKIPKRLIPVLVTSVKIALDFKYSKAKFDSELLDLIELADLINGGSP